MKTVVDLAENVSSIPNQAQNVNEEDLDDVPARSMLKHSRAVEAFKLSALFYDIIFLTNSHRHMEVQEVQEKDLSLTEDRKKLHSYDECTDVA